MVAIIHKQGTQEEEDNPLIKDITPRRCGVDPRNYVCFSELKISLCQVGGAALTLFSLAKHKTTVRMQQ
jgi:hypothetical protein